MEITNEQKIAQAEISEAVRKLVYACNHNNAGVVGFAFSANPPLVVRFGNVTETGPQLTKVLIQLSDLAEEIEADGKAIRKPIPPENHGEQTV